MADDYGNDTSTNAVAFVGTPVNGNIEVAGDRDWFRVTLNAGTPYTIDLEGADTSRGTLADPELQILTAAGTLLSSDDDSGAGLNSQLVYTPLSTGIYYIAAASHIPGGSGTYRLSVAGAADDYPANTSTGGVFTSGSFITGNIESAGDNDWFRIVLNGGQNYQFDLEGVDTGRGTLGDPRMQLLNSAGTALASDDDAGTGVNAQLTFTPPSTGTYYVVAMAYSSSATGTYRLSATGGGGGGGADDYIGSAATSGVVAMGGFSTGNIETTGDVDWFRVALNAGTSYRFDLEGVDTGRGTLADPQLELFNTSGTLVIANDDDSGTGLNSQITYTPTASGTYFLGALSHTTAGGTYRISASVAGPTDDYGSSTSTAGAINIGQSLNGTIEAGGDVDWFSVALAGGQSYQFDLRGVDSGRGTLADPKLYLLNSAGNAITFSDDDGTGLDAMIQFSPAAQAGGVYYLAAQGYSNTMTGTYQLTASQMGGGGGVNPVLQTSYQNILRGTATGAEATFLTNLSNQVSSGALTQAQANAQIVAHAINTTSVATMAYEFFTGRIPSQGGIDYLVSPTGPNPNNLNSPYYQNFNVENRYINFAVNLGKLGEGAATFSATYGGLDLFNATKAAYRTIFGATPTDAKVHALLDPTFVLGGQAMSRADYFAYYGQDGQNGIGTKAAMVGWLMAEAAKADVGMYARSNDAFLFDLADGATFGVDIVGVYGRPEYVFLG